MNRFLLALLGALAVPSAMTWAQESAPAQPRWWKGNLHTHSLWSDGDDFPEMIGDWYRSQGYHFLALTDHNTLSEGMRWMKASAIVKRSDADVLRKYKERFGEHWVETRGDPASEDHEFRLKPLSEFRGMLEQSGRFLLIPAEEISDRAGAKMIHINATNLAETIPPAGGDSVRDVMRNNLRAIFAHEKEHGSSVLPHVNHPNFGYSITAEDLAAVTSEKFFEVYNGHPGVNHLGDQDHPSVERIWDLANAIRRTKVNVAPLMGIATDDSHEYHGKPGSRPGRGWVMVRSRFLTPEHLIEAMKRGDFYASSGVTLKTVSFNEGSNTLSLEIQPEDDAVYRTDFIATLRPEGDSDLQIGVRVASVDGAAASYTLTGRELYVRAVVHSSAPHRDPSYKGQLQQAWTQPVGWNHPERSFAHNQDDTAGTQDAP
ncbi:MAG: hypothetical protein AAF989_07735 [Planctomycetota bacterium]